MNHPQIVEIANAQNSISVAADLNFQFLQHCAQHPTPQEFKTRLEIKGTQISVSGFGHTATAEARLIRTENGMYAAEYVFSAPLGEKSVEVWRCYVVSNGCLAADPSAQVIICDYNNAYIAKYICGPILLGILGSSLLAPAPREGA